MRRKGGSRQVIKGAAAFVVMVVAVPWTIRLLAAGHQVHGCRVVLVPVGLLVAAALVALRLRSTHEDGITLPIAGAVSGVLVLAAVTWLLFGIPVADAIVPWVLVTIVGLAGLCEVAARQWSTRWLRIVVVGVVLATLALMVKVGRQELDNSRLAEGRDTARVLAERKTASDQATTSAVTSATKAASAALAASRKAIGGAVGDPSPAADVPAGCQARQDSLAAVCAAFGELRAIADAPADAGVPERLAALKVSLEGLRQQNDLATAARERIEGLVAAVDAVSAKAEILETRTKLVDKAHTADEKLKALCTAAGGSPAASITDHHALACAKSAPAGAAMRRLAIARAEAEQAVAAFSAGATGSDEDKAALSHADAALVRAQSEEHDPAPLIGMPAVLAAGGGGLTRHVPGLGGGRVPVGLAVAGWTALGALLLVAYRRLEILNSARGLSRVKIDKFVGGAKNEHEELEAAFHRHVIANVPEPGAVPGAGSVTNVTDLLEASSDPISKVLASVLKIVRGITAASAGYALDATYSKVPGAAGPAVEHEVFVRIRDARTGATEATKTCREETAGLAVRAGGYWAASWILGKDRTAPSWAAWSGQSAEALAACDEAMDASGTAALGALQRAIRTAPTSGVLLVRLANTLDLTGEHVAALEFNLRAATCHPRYAVARYRLAISLNIVAADVESRWLQLTGSTRRRITASLERCATTCGVKKVTTADIENPLAATADVRRELSHDAEQFLNSAAALFDRRCIARNAFRRPERRYWAPMLVSGDGRANRTRFCDTVTSAGYTMSARGSGQSVAGAAAKAAEARLNPSSWWQVLYNYACYFGVRFAATHNVDEGEEAVKLLEQVMERDESGQLTRNWVDQDPDLAALAPDARFREFLDRLAARQDEKKST